MRETHVGYLATLFLLLRQNRVAQPNISFSLRAGVDLIDEKWRVWEIRGGICGTWIEERARDTLLATEVESWRPPGRVVTRVLSSVFARRESNP